MSVQDSVTDTQTVAEPDLAGTVAVVTGGSHGIGLAVVSALAQRGARVITGARSSSLSLDRLVATAEVTYVPVELTQPEGASTLGEAAGPRIDYLVNNVGTSVPRAGGFAQVSDDQWWSSLELNLMAAVRVTRMVLPRMSVGGCIVTVTSDNARLPDPSLVDYGASKAALANVTKALSFELAPRGIRVNAVSPGPVATRRWSTAEARQVAAARMPTGRLTTPEQVAAAVLWLAAGEAANVTGATLTVDGGLLPVTWS